jgi:hypothetical protein
MKKHIAVPKRRLPKKKSMCLQALFVPALGLVAQSQRTPSQDPASERAALEAKHPYIGLVSPATTTTRSHVFKSGGNSFLKFCVTANGNITVFQNFSGREYFHTAPIGEAYAFCDFDASKQYFDYAGHGDSGNWNAPTLELESFGNHTVVVNYKAF